jgi:hypothetical protein
LWNVNTVHQDLAVKALKAIGMSDDVIRGYFSGNIILDAAQPDAPTSGQEAATVCANCGNPLRENAVKGELLDGDHLLFCSHRCWQIYRHSAPASEQDIEAFKQFEAGHQAADASALEVANRLIEQMRRDEKRLQAELTATQQQLAAAESAGQTSQNLWLDEKDRYSSLYNDYILQQRSIEELEAKLETLSGLDHLQMWAIEAAKVWMQSDRGAVQNISDALYITLNVMASNVSRRQATPQPAPEASALRAAVNWLITIAPVDRPTLPSVDASKSVDAIASEFYAVGWAAATFGAAEKLKTALKAGE